MGQTSLNGGGISVVTSDAQGQGVCSLYEFAFDPALVNGLRMKQSFLI